MRRMVRSVGVAAVLTTLGVSPLAAQNEGRPQDGFYSGQSNGQSGGQSNGQVNERVDGRANKNEGLPPSAADKANGKFDNPVYQQDCNEVDALNPDARPGYQARVRAACQ
jgi:hypothetical protein